MLMAMGHTPNRKPFQKGIAFSTQCTAMADAVHCRGGCSALRERLQCTASEMEKTGTEKGQSYSGLLVSAKNLW